MKIKYVFVFILGLGLISCADENSLLGDAYYNEGKYEEAIKAYNDFLELNPRHTKTIYNRGRCYQQLGEHEKAIEDFQQVLKLDQRNESALLSLGQEMYRTEDYESVIFYSDKVLELRRNNAMAYYLKARAEQKLGNLRNALNNYNTAINLEPDFGEAYLHRGSVNLFFKRQANACKDLAKAKELGVAGAAEAHSKNCR